jgi:hypothetical protein
MKWAEYVACMGKMSNAFKVLIGDVKTILNIKMDLKKMGCEFGLDSSGSK